MYNLCQTVKCSKWAFPKRSLLFLNSYDFPALSFPLKDLRLTFSFSHMTEQLRSLKKQTENVTTQDPELTRVTYNAICCHPEIVICMYMLNTSALMDCYGIKIWRGRQRNIIVPGRWSAWRRMKWLYGTPPASVSIWIVQALKVKDKEITTTL